MSINGDFAESEYGDDYAEQEDDGLSDTTSERFDPKADKRAHHNALERKRRDHIKDSFSSLRNAVPTFNGEKVQSSASRAQILKKAAEYINVMRNKNLDHQRDIDCLKRENKLLEEKIVRALEQMKNGGMNGATLNLGDNGEEDMAQVKSEYSNDFDSSNTAESMADKSSSNGQTGAMGRVKKSQHTSQTTSGQNSPSKRRKVTE